MTRRLIDLDQPVGLLLVAVVHFLGDADDPWALVAALRDRLPPGSYLVLSHATSESMPEVIRAAAAMYNSRVGSTGRARSRAEIQGLFDGFELVDPGLVYVPQWRPGPADEVPADPSQLWFLAGVGRKP